MPISNRNAVKLRQTTGDKSALAADKVQARQLEIGLSFVPVFVQSGI